MTQKSKLTELIIEKAKALLAGVTSIDSLKQSPSHIVYPKIGAIASTNEITNKEINCVANVRELIQYKVYRNIFGIIELQKNKNIIEKVGYSKR